MITKAVIPAAGAGTRLLPATKAQPKEMLPILDIPTIQFVVQEAVDAGIEDILFITGRDKRAIEDHFDTNIELEAHLERRGDESALRTVRELATLARIHYVRQPTPAGLGDAVSLARAFVGDDPFVVLLGDTVFDGKTPVTRQLVEAYEQHQKPVIAVEEVAPENVSRYGIVEGTALEQGAVRVKRLIEKPLPTETDSTLAIAGRYVLTPEIFDKLEITEPGRNNEIQLTDALASMLSDTSIVAIEVKGRRYDIGNKLDYLSAILAFAHKRDEFKGVIDSFVTLVAAPKDL